MKLPTPDYDNVISGNDEDKREIYSVPMMSTTIHDSYNHGTLLERSKSRTQITNILTLNETISYTQFNRR